MLVVSNSSPLIFLSKIGHTALLEVCFKHLVIPQAVAQEVGLDLLLNLPCEVRGLDAAGEAFVHKELGRLHRGELEAIWLAKTLQVDALLLDDRRARRRAKDLGLRPLGTLGVLVYAHKLRALSLAEVQRAVTSLQTEANVYLSGGVLQAVGEQLVRQEEENVSEADG